jgi:hypothetical protein
VANTCSFNSLLQTYFMIPQLRHEILRFRSQQSASSRSSNKALKCSTSSDKLRLLVISELQKLFSVMMLTKRPADPTEVIKALLTGSSSSIRLGSQEDVHGKYPL